MAGGLVQIVAYGTQDIFLTGDPQITFFKVVYRRHTNFAVEYKEEFFDGNPNFGEEVSLTLSRNGDLAYRMYLRIDLPEVRLTKAIDEDALPQLQIERDQALADFENFEAYSKWILGGYRTIIQELEILNHTASSVANQLNSYFTTDVDITDYNNRRNNITITEHVTRTDIFSKINAINVNPLLTDDEKLAQMVETNEQVKNAIIEIHKFYYDDYLAKNQALIDASNTNINFAWIKKLGHFIIKEAEVRVGGDKIDRHYGDWLNIWSELSRNVFMDDIYNKMIGNVEVLTTYDQNIKPRYTLLIPLMFWFNRFNGLAIPLICMKYHDVVIEIEYEKLENLVFFDYDNFNNDLIDQIQIENSSLFIDYVFLDNDERRKFAQSSHEYLIEQLQRIKIDNVTTRSFTFQLDLFHPCKEIVWVVQRASRLDPNNKDCPTSTDPGQLSFYGITDAGEDNPVSIALLEFNGYPRMQRLDGTYFNYVQPYQCHSNTPADGINVFSFALHPEMHQPSGHVNMSRLDLVNLTLTFDDSYISDVLLDGDTIEFRLYAVTYNIFRIIGGMGGLTFAV